MAKADITLRGRAYSIACAPGQETRIQLLAEQLNARVDQISGAVGDIGEERLLLIASLALLDELDAARRSKPGAVQAEQKVADALSSAAERIEALAARIEGGH
ncbi:cell division protein ZapA [Hyphomonas sp.]|uniref:cell division protein ZapA n=1 Tax=Hyphomonas sp. TaxID=87 RepID=UPI0032EAF19E|tara:strand:- start:7003 stop:7311 length:309 start_codon:yes stop_codon:yes gene_type:complete